ncbi:MAG: thiamine pyrophosphate-binding protein, partial [Candidatus Hydrogenedentes bacterium]|nr:thiamine pyrophosphate-binding protein [Candidatus Hydrogenedentota bacterium]
MNQEQLTAAREKRAAAIAHSGGVFEAIASGTMTGTADITLSEAIVLGLLVQNVRNYIGIFGHGSTEVGEVLRVYEKAGLVKVFPVRHETEAVHAVTALRWVTGEKSAVFTSIGPGALHALAGSLAAVSDGLGFWLLVGDETTEDEGPNMQQIPKPDQGLFQKLFGVMSGSYTLHTPGAVTKALRRGYNVVDHPYRAAPFCLCMPMNTQPVMIPDFNLNELPAEAPPRMGAAADDGAYALAAKAILEAERVVVKVGGGARGAGPELLDFLELAGGVAVTSPLVSGVIPFNHPRNMTVGGSKGSLSGNYAMDEGDLLVALGTRFVCQSDSSRTGYPKVRQVVNINADIETAMHYRKSIPLVGDVALTLGRLNGALRAAGAKSGNHSPWLKACHEKRLEWDAFRAARYQTPVLHDPMWEREVLTQPAAIKIASDWCRAHNAVAFFDAGDVQANGFQIVEDDRLGRTFTETGASYMGFAVSALLATAMTDTPFYAVAFSGDGSFTMNPQI